MDTVCAVCAFVLQPAIASGRTQGHEPSQAICSSSSICFQAKRAELEEIAQKVEDMRQVEQWEILHELYGKIIAWQQVRLQQATLPLACMADMIGNI